MNFPDSLLTGNSSSSAPFPYDDGSYPLVDQLYNLSIGQLQSVIVSVTGSCLCISLSFLVVFWFFVHPLYRPILRSVKFNWYFILAVLCTFVEALAKLISGGLMLTQDITVEECRVLGLIANVMDCCTTVFTIAFYVALIFIRLRGLRQAYHCVVPTTLQGVVGFFSWFVVAIAMSVFESMYEGETLAVLGHCFRTPRPMVRGVLTTILGSVPVLTLISLKWGRCTGLSLRGRITWRRHWPLMIRFFVPASLCIMGNVLSLTVTSPSLRYLPLLSAFDVFIYGSVPFLFLLTENLFLATYQLCKDGAQDPDAANDGKKDVLVVSDGEDLHITSLRDNTSEAENVSFFEERDASSPKSIVQVTNYSTVQGCGHLHKQHGLRAEVMDGGVWGAVELPTTWEGNDLQKQLLNRGFTLVFRTLVGMEMRGTVENVVEKK